MLRLPNKFHIGAKELRHRALFTVAMSATPVMSTPQVRPPAQITHYHTNFLQDLVNIGNFLGIRGFEEDADELDEYRRMTDKFKRKDRAERKAAGINEATVARAFVKGKKTKRQDYETQYDRSLQEWIDKLRELFQEHIIRRTIDSLDWKGEPISGLPPYHEHPLLLTLTEEERSVLDQLAEQVVKEGAGVRQLHVSSIPCYDVPQLQPGPLYLRGAITGGGVFDAAPAMPSCALNAYPWTHRGQAAVRRRRRQSLMNTEHCCDRRFTSAFGCA